METERLAMRELPTHMPKSQPCPKCGKWVKRSKLITYKEDSNVGAEYYCKKDDLTFFEPDHLVPQLVMQRLRELKMAKKELGWMAGPRGLSLEGYTEDGRARRSKPS